MTAESTHLRILYVIHGYKPAYHLGGPILSVSAAAESLVARGHKVVVFATNSNLDEDLDVPVNRAIMVDGVEIWYFERKEPLKKALPFCSYLSKSMGYLYAPKMARALEQQISGFDLIHTHMPYIYPTLAAGRAALKAGKPLFYHQHGVFDPELLKFRGIKKRLYIAAFDRPIMRKATMLIALTERERDNYRALKVNTHCSVIPNGIDTKLYYRVPTDDLASSFPIRSDQLMVLFLGRLHPTKGADLLLEAFLSIESQFPKAVLVMAGPDEYGLEAQFKKRVHAAGLRDRVFFPGMVSGHFKLNLLARADIFCLPSMSEGFSIAILEALASATPVMISPGCHFPEVAAHGAGVIVERSIDKWSETLARLLHEPHQLGKMGEAALSLVESNYTWENVVTRLEEAYKEGIARHKISMGVTQ